MTLQATSMPGIGMDAAAQMFHAMAQGTPEQWDRMIQAARAIVAGAPLVVVDPLPEPIKCLDNGWVKCTDYSPRVSMPPDHAVLHGARPEAEDIDRGLAKNGKLLRTLWQADPSHTSPFEQPVLHLDLNAPLMVWWHILRHRWLSPNVGSGRYHAYDAKAFYMPAPYAWRKQSAKNHQGSEGLFTDDEGVEFCSELVDHASRSWALYESWLAKGMAREQARLVLPAFGLYIEGTIQLNAMSLINIILQRSHPDAQHETQVYGDAFRSIFKSVMPQTYQQVFAEYMTPERQLLQEWLRLHNGPGTGYAAMDGPDIVDRTNVLLSAAQAMAAR